MLSGRGNATAGGYEANPSGPYLQSQTGVHDANVLSDSDDDEGVDYDKITEDAQATGEDVISTVDPAFLFFCCVRLIFPFLYYLIYFRLFITVGFLRLPLEDLLCAGENHSFLYLCVCVCVCCSFFLSCKVLRHQLWLVLFVAYRFPFYEWTAWENDRLLPGDGKADNPATYRYWVVTGRFIQ